MMNEEEIHGSIEEFRGEFEFLSNFYPHPFEYDGDIYPTAEHAFQAAKADDPDERARVRNAPTPARAKQLGKKVTLRADWDTRRFEIMEMVLFHKFIDPDLNRRLLATGDRELIEGTRWRDTTWGCVRGANGEWRGRNELGKLLMHVRKMNRIYERNPLFPPLHGTITFTDCEILSPLNQLNAMQVALTSDVGGTLKLLSADEQHRSARTSFIRSAFALVEGMLNGMSEMALALQSKSHSQLTGDDVNALNGVKISRTDAGEKKTNLAFKDRVKGVLDTFGKVFGVTYSLKYGTRGGESFLASAKVRDRLMHPKTAESLTITDEELAAAREGYNWFVGNLASIWQSISEKGNLLS